MVWHLLGARPQLVPMLTHFTDIALQKKRQLALKQNKGMFINWGRVTHICVSEIIIIGSYNGLSPDRRQAIIWTNDGIL